jgi:hypothetical protein
MRKNNQIQKRYTILGMVLLFFLIWPNGFLEAANYGTTTFFSNKKEKPALEKPILGAETPQEDDNDDDDDDDDENDEDDDEFKLPDSEDVFNQIGDAVSGVVDTSSEIFNETKKSLFDFQSDFSNDFGRNKFESSDDFFISGPRGESPEYMASLNEDGETTVEFNFEDTNLKVAPKKSKFLFTNSEIAVDRTSQYVVLAIIFVIALMASVGYYYAQKGNVKRKRGKL